jgi:hypothetical protein
MITKGLTPFLGAKVFAIMAYARNVATITSGEPRKSGIMNLLNPWRNGHTQIDCRVR